MTVLCGAAVNCLEINIPLALIQMYRFQGSLPTRYQFELCSIKYFGRELQVQYTPVD